MLQHTRGNNSYVIHAKTCKTSQGMHRKIVTNNLAESLCSKLHGVHNLKQTNV